MRGRPLRGSRREEAHRRWPPLRCAEQANARDCAIVDAAMTTCCGQRFTASGILSKPCGPGKRRPSLADRRAGCARAPASCPRLRSRAGAGWPPRGGRGWRLRDEDALEPQLATPCERGDDRWRQGAFRAPARHADRMCEFATTRARVTNAARRSRQNGEIGLAMHAPSRERVLKSFDPRSGEATMARRHSVDDGRRRRREA